MRISYFVDGYPDELLYSMAARYAMHLRLPSHMTVYEQWFGTQATNAVIDFPARLDHLVQMLPSGHAYTADRLIDHHTLYPLYAAFLPDERAQALRVGMRGAGQSLHWIAGVARCTIKRPQWLHYCPACVEADRQQYGETYWHRCHQVPGVSVCPHHAGFLAESRVNIHSRAGRKQLMLHERFVAAEQELPVSLPTTDPTPAPRVLVQIAQDAFWLLRCRLERDCAWIHQQERALLRQQGLLTAGGLLRQHALIQALYARVPLEILALLHCELRETGDGWLVRLVQPAEPHPHHPIYHLLLLRLLGHTIHTFRTSIGRPDRPFGEGPWPCLNPLCPSYRQRCIATYTVRSGGNRQPVGTFICACGYAYSRAGPNRTPQDHFRHGQIADYGHLWKQHLIERWPDPQVSLAQLATEMHTTPKTIRRLAALLQLPFAPEAPQRGKRPACYQDQVEARRADQRATWLQVQAEHPQAWLTQLVRLEPATYRWLQQHDAAWLHQHLPVEAVREHHKATAQRERKQSAHAQQIAQRDHDLATAIRQAAQRLREKPGFPVRIGCATMSQEIGCVPLWSHARLPPHLTLARQALEEARESLEDHIARRLAWTVQCYQEEQQHPSQTKFFRRAKLYWKVLQRPTIRSLAEATYERSFGRGLPEA
ncbi:MAG TPA: TnsD family Tn7-like transposition protein [Ktedonobacterales bacterium]|nr:TnsD family Tn7-like transposition protein [Ktedonobacterales bacterium]